MTVIGFVRHGVTAWNKEGRAQGSTNIPLDEEGIDMAKAVANRLAEEQWDIIYTSPLQRAKQTAEFIEAKKPGITLVEDNRLREFGGGLIEGTTEAERVAKWGWTWRSLELGIEPNEEIIARGMDFIEEIQTTYAGQRVLVVSHGGFIKRLVSALVPHEDLGPEMNNTSVSVVALSDDRNHCRLYNCTKHLQLID